MPASCGVRLAFRVLHSMQELYDVLPRTSGRPGPAGLTLVQVQVLAVTGEPPQYWQVFLSRSKMVVAG
jgi:hypothetical protein